MPGPPADLSADLSAEAQWAKAEAQWAKAGQSNLRAVQGTDRAPGMTSLGGRDRESHALTVGTIHRAHRP